MAQPTYDFTDHVVVVTGGSRGVGAGIVAAFVASGATVVTCGRNEVDVPGAVFVTADVRRPKQAQLVVDTAVGRFGRLDVLVTTPCARMLSVAPPTGRGGGPLALGLASTTTPSVGPVDRFSGVKVPEDSSF